MGIVRASDDSCNNALLEPLGDIPPAEFEAQYYAQAAVPDSTNSVSDAPGTVQVQGAAQCWLG